MVASSRSRSAPWPATEAPSFLRLEDQIIGRLLSTGAGPHRRLGGPADAETLRRMLETGRCHWRNGRSMALTVGEPRRGTFGWRFDVDGQQHVICDLEEQRGDVVILALGAPWYIDLEQHTCGEIRTEVPDQVSAVLLRAPAVPATAATLVRQRLQPIGDLVPLPESSRRRDRVEVKPIPVLHLHCPRVTVSRGLGWKREEQEVDLPLARVTFDYAGFEIGWQDGRSEINHVADNRLMVMARDTVLEVQSVERLNQLGLQPLGPTGLGRFAPEASRQDFTFEEDEDDDVSLRWVEFNHGDLPRLAVEGWRITYDPGYPYRVVRPRRSLERRDQRQRHRLVRGQCRHRGRWRACRRYLPVLLDLFRRAPEEMTPQALAEYRRRAHLRHLPDGRLHPDRRLAPQGRRRIALRALRAATASTRAARSRLDRMEATRLAALERGMPRGGLSWKGGEQLMAMARRLGEVSEVPLVPQPAGLKAQLRGYQQQGLSWLQFLSSFGLSGVLADDMGLGKTLQALAHILTEKSLGRLDRPCLVVVPTSLIPTWRNEIASLRAEPSTC